MYFVRDIEIYSHYHNQTQHYFDCPEIVTHNRKRTNAQLLGIPKTAYTHTHTRTHTRTQVHARTQTHTHTHTHTHARTIVFFIPHSQAVEKPHQYPLTAKLSQASVSKEHSTHVNLHAEV